MKAPKGYDHYDEDDVRVRPSRRGSRPRSKDRPRHDDPVDGRVIAVDRGRYHVLIDDVLVTAVKSAGLVDTLNNAPELTVFAPTNDAFAAVPKATMDAAMADPKGLLTKVLTNHVVEGKIAPDKLAGDHKTLGGGTINVAGSGEDFTVGKAKVICGNVQTANATVYIIDGVLLPAM